MPTFIENCNCKGSAPESMRRTRHSLRPHIIGELLRDRSVTRFLIAPKGYGKSAVAFEYAQIMFEFKHVFWIDCGSPCFLRDLDNEDIWEEIKKCDSEVKLVIFDDIKALDSQRSLVFSKLCTLICDSGCEVIITCLPAASSLAQELSNSQVITSSSLMLSDDELAVERSRGNVYAKDEGDLKPAERIAALIWQKDGEATIVNGIATEMLLASMRVLIFCILTLKKGKLTDLKNLSDSHTFDDDISMLEKDYPFLGIDCSLNEFDAIEISCEDIKSKAGFTQTELGAIVSSKNLYELISSLANQLSINSGGKRAFSFLKTFASKDQIADWIKDQGWTLVLEGEALLVARLCEFVRDDCTKARITLDALCVWAYAILGDMDAAKKMYRRVSGSKIPSWAYKCSCSILLLFASRFEESQNALAALDVGLSLLEIDDGDVKASLAAAPFNWSEFFDLSRKILDICCADNAGAAGADGGDNANDANDANDADSANDLNDLGDANVSSDTSDGNIALAAKELMHALVDSPSKKSTASAVLLAAWTISRVIYSKEISSLNPLWKDVIFELCKKLESALDDSEHLPLSAWVCYECERVLDAIFERFPFDFDTRLSSEVQSHLYEMGTKIASQSRQYKKLQSDKNQQIAQKALTCPDSFRYDKAMREVSSQLRAAIPLLDIKLFGGFDARIGGKTPNSRVLARKKAKMALAILMLGKGREVSKERITEALWPESEYEFRQRNFYVVWSDLRRALTIDSDCPYLVRTQTGYKIDTRYVTSDLEQFDDLCKDLLFGDNDMSAWREMFDKASSDYSEDLLPGINENDFINSMRSYCRTQLVEGLIAASFRMSKKSEYRGAIWFAREAIRRDPSREDAYIALMEAQIYSDQRGAALDTYFECRHQLSELLGIDPCPRIVELYRSIIETEEVF